MRARAALHRRRARCRIGRVRSSPEVEFHWVWLSMQVFGLMCAEENESDLWRILLATTMAGMALAIFARAPIGGQSR